MNNLEKKITLLVSLALAEDDATRQSIKDALAKEAENVNSEASNRLSLKCEVTKLIQELGIPAHIKGYNYVREAIVLSVQNPDILESITHELYPAVAKAFNTTGFRVERAIRHAIETAWNRGDTEVLYKYFGNTVSYDKGKTTNSEFISLLTDHLRLKGEYDEMD
jgi:two-component system response regulator (stage 0 sporulation protein A)